MTVQKLESTDAFIVIDLDGVDQSLGVVRCAPKVLIDGAKLLARSITYTFAAFEQRASGASAGVNAPADTRAEAVASFVSETTPLVATGGFVADPGKGVEGGALASFDAVDPRPPWAREHRDRLVATTAVAAAEEACGGLDGRSVAIELFDRVGAEVAHACAQRGARVVAVGSPTATVIDESGLDPSLVAGAFAEHGVDAIAHLDRKVLAAPALFGAKADILWCGSKAGVIDHVGAGVVSAKVVVPIGPVPVTAKALAVLARRESVVLPDFVTLAGSRLVTFGDLGSSLEEAELNLRDRVRALVASVSGSDRGVLLGACLAAEVFLGTWRDELPFGRPLA